MPTLYVVATPIGNLEDLTPRAARVLAEVTVIAAENTNTARRLLSHLGLRGKRYIPYNEHNRRSRIPQVVSLLHETDVVLVSEAGTPGISDPGTELVRAVRAAGHAVVPIPGPSAPIAALSASGITARTFTFVGFLPVSKKDGRAVLARLAPTPEALVLLEAPHRLPETLTLLREALGDRAVTVGREITKLHEEFWTGTLSGALTYFAEPRGEFTIVVEGAAGQAPTAVEFSTAVTAPIIEQSATSWEAVTRLQEELGLSRREAYRLWLKGKRGS